MHTNNDATIPADTEYRITYEEQCVDDSDHHHVSIDSTNNGLDEVLAVDPPTVEECPVCGAEIIHLSNRRVND